MNLKEVIDRIEGGETELDPSLDLFKDSLERAEALASHGIKVFEDEKFKSQFFAPEVTGIMIEIASYASASRIVKATENQSLQETLTRSIKGIRMSAWEALFIRLPDEERNRFTAPRNCEVFTRTANLNAKDIIHARHLEGEALKDQLNGKIPPRMRMMQGIRLGQITI